jgi:hypothetical protein
MEVDFAAFAARVAAHIDVRGCLVVSRDGFVLGEHTTGAPGELSEAWSRFASLGPPDRAFLRYRDSVWAYVSGSNRGLFAVASSSSLPGALLDRLDAALALAVPAPDAAPTWEAAASDAEAKPHAVPRPAPPEETAATTGPGPAKEEAPSPPNVPDRLDLTGADPPEPSSDPEEVDAVALAREFGGLFLQDGRFPDEN